MASTVNTTKFGLTLKSIIEWNHKEFVTHCRNLLKKIMVINKRLLEDQNQ